MPTADPAPAFTDAPPAPAPATDAPVDFDDHAASYQADLARGIRVSGESADHFARRRAAWTRARLDRMGVAPASVLDFGCGTGGSVPHLLAWPSVRRLLGVDPSAASLRVAGQSHPDARAAFHVPEDAPADPLDLAYTNGVFHHITAAERPEALRFVSDRLKPGGLFVLWENNPLNPGTRLVMRRCAFDRDAEPFSAGPARKMLREAGFDVLRTDHLFLFPRVLSALRPAEAWVSGLPIGAQYAVFARRR